MSMAVKTAEAICNFLYNLQNTFFQALDRKTK